MGCHKYLLRGHLDSQKYLLRRQLGQLEIFITTVIGLQYHKNTSSLVAQTFQGYYDVSQKTTTTINTTTTITTITTTINTTTTTTTTTTTITTTTTVGAFFGCRTILVWITRP